MVPLGAKLISAVLMAIAALTLSPALATAGPPRHFYGVANQDTLGPTDFPLMEKAGVGSVRLFIHWPSIQARPGNCQADLEVGVCDWRRYDAMIGGLAAAGIEAFPYILNSPSFVAADPEMPPIRGRHDRDQWLDFLRALVNRYGRAGSFWQSTYASRYPGFLPMRIHRWEIWNEPSDAPYWHPRPDPREYAKLVRISGTAIHSADRRANVVLAGLYGFPNEKKGGINARTFYRELFEIDSLGRYFDDVAIHPYGPNLGHVAAQIATLRDLMRHFGYRRRAIWITEVGWASDGIHHRLGKRPSRQARLLTDAFRLFERHRDEWNLRGAYWYAWQDYPSLELCGFCAGSGLVESDREPKPAYRAFKRVAR